MKEAKVERTPAYAQNYRIYPDLSRRRFRRNRLLGETLLKHHLLDVLDLSVHPLVLGHGRQFFRQGQNATLKPVAAKSFSTGIVKLTYEPQSEGR